MATLSITWHSVGDNHVCPICKELNGYTWVFETGKDVLTDSLWHPVHGQVWSLSEGSNAHGHHFQPYGCRCSISHQFDLSDIEAKCRLLAEQIQAAVATVE
jgi:hypothetical protein